MKLATLKQSVREGSAEAHALERAEEHLASCRTLGDVLAMLTHAAGIPDEFAGQLIAAEVIRARFDMTRFLASMNIYGSLAEPWRRAEPYLTRPLPKKNATAALAAFLGVTDR